MDTQEYMGKINTIVQKCPSYHPDAYHFVMGALSFTVAQLKEARHITGQEFAIGAGKYAIKQYGPLAMTVLGYWHIHETIDFGRIVYNLIKVGLMHKTKEDSLTDFVDVYSFDAFFAQHFNYLGVIDD